MHLEEGCTIDDVFPKADWEELSIMEEFQCKVTEMTWDVNLIISAAPTCIPCRSKVSVKEKMVPWLDEKCRNAIKERNRNSAQLHF